jgi:uncharacterized coiled-coil DUF342 family protein
MEGHDMPEPMTDGRLAEIRDKESRNLAKLFDSTVTELLAEVDRLRAQVEQYHRSADEHVAKFDRKHAALMDARAEFETLRLVNAGHVRLIADLAAERDNLVWQRDQLKEINDRMAEDRMRLIAECDQARGECDELKARGTE